MTESHLPSYLGPADALEDAITVLGMISTLFAERDPPEFGGHAHQGVHHTLERIKRDLRAVFPRIDEHVKHCTEHAHQCGYRQGMAEAEGDTERAGAEEIKRQLGEMFQRDMGRRRPRRGSGQGGDDGPHA